VKSNDRKGNENDEIMKCSEVMKFSKEGMERNGLKKVILSSFLDLLSFFVLFCPARCILTVCKNYEVGARLF